MQKLFLLALTTLGSCATPEVSMWTDSVVPIAQGTISGRTAKFGGEASFEELGVEDADQVWSTSRIDLRGEGNSLSLGYMPGVFAGEGTLGSDLQLGGETFSRDTGVRTQLGAGLLTARWTKHVIDSEAVTLGVGLGVCGLDLSMKVEEIGGPGVGEFEELIPLPMAVARIEGDLGSLGYEASYGFFKGSAGDGQGHFKDLDARLRMELMGPACELVLGYHTVEMDGPLDDVATLDVALGGPYLGLSLRF